MAKGKGYFERGTPRIDKDKCTNCGLCAEVCGGQPLMKVDGKVEINPDAALGCLGCAQCMLVCPTGSISVTGRGILPDDVFDLKASPARIDLEQLESLLVPRRSMRRFATKEVDRSLVDRIIRAASAAPMGIPPSEVGIVIFHGRDRVAELSKDTAASMEDLMRMLNPVTLALFRPFMKKTDIEGLKEFVLPIAKVMENERSKGADPVLYSAPVALLFHRSPYADPADPYIAATYAMLAAEAAGLGTCMIGLVTVFMERDKKMMAKYGIPKGNKPVLVVIMGYPGMKFKKSVKRRFASVKHWEPPKASR